jgi:hypothetical protein
MHRAVDGPLRQISRARDHSQPNAMCVNHKRTYAALSLAKASLAGWRLRQQKWTLA